MSGGISRYPDIGAVLARLPRTWVAAAAWALAAVCGALQCRAALSRPPGDRLPDLDVYRGAVRLLLAGGSLYDFAAPETAAPFTYPPFAGLLFTPLAAVPAEPLRYLWTGAILACTTVLGWLVVRAAREPLPGPGSAPQSPGSPPQSPGTAAEAGLVTAALLASAPVSSNLRFGQVSVALAVLVVVDLSPLMPIRLRGALTGLAAGIKLTPLVFVPVLWLSGRRRAAVTAVAAFAGTVGLGWLVLPAESARFWLHELRDVQRIGHLRTGGNQSLNGALLRLGVPAQTRGAVILAAVLVVGLIAVWRAGRLMRSGQWLGGTVVVGAAGVVVSPVSWTHHQIWLVLAAFVPVAASNRARAAWAAAVLVVMVAPVTSLGSGLPGVAGWLLGEARLLLALAVAVAVPFGRPAPQVRQAGAAVASCDDGTA
jgi:alpha-1,2-mannosyltransferase